MRRWTLKLTMPVGSGSSYPFGSHPLIAECSVTQSTDEVGASVGHHAIVAHVLTDGTVDDAPIGLELIDVVDDDLASVTADGIVKLRADALDLYPFRRGTRGRQHQYLGHGLVESSST